MREAIIVQREKESEKRKKTEKESEKRKKPIGLSQGVHKLDSQS